MKARVVMHKVRTFRKGVTISWEYWVKEASGNRTDILLAGNLVLFNTHSLTGTRSQVVELPDRTRILCIVQVCEGSQETVAMHLVQKHQSGRGRA